MSYLLIVLSAWLAAQDVQPQFKARTELVQVDVRVSGEDNRPVADLTADDFAVFSERTPLPVETAYLVRNGFPVEITSTRDAALSVSLSQRPLATKQAWVFIFDGSLGTSGFRRAKEALAAFLSDDLPPGDLAGVMVGGTVLGGELTDNRARLLEIAQQLRLPAERASASERLTADEARAIAAGDSQALQAAVARLGCDSTGACDDVQQLVEAEAKFSASMLERSAVDTLSGIIGAARRIREFPGPRGFVIFSEGFDLWPVLGRLRVAAEQAIRANVRLYVVDTRGLRGAPDSLTRPNAGVPRVALPDAGSAVPRQTAFDFDPADALNSLAADTGGKFIRNHNDFRRALGEILSEAGSYYVLGVRAPETDTPGPWRPLKVDVHRRGVTVSARRGYLAASR